MITKAIRNCIDQAGQRGWKKTFWAFDIHNTMIIPNYSSEEIPPTFYPHALEVMQLISRRSNIVRILYTCSHPAEIEKYLHLFQRNRIHFDYVNENPDVCNDGYGFYDHKLYFNVLFEDKAGFDPITDWLEVKNLLSGIWTD